MWVGEISEIGLIFERCYVWKAWLVRLMSDKESRMHPEPAYPKHTPKVAMRVVGAEGDGTQGCAGC